jgi:hypothetical protein
LKSNFLKKKLKIILLILLLISGGIYFAWYKYNSSFGDYFVATYHKRLNGRFLLLSNPDLFLDSDTYPMPDKANADTCRKWLAEWMDRINSTRYSWLDGENKGRFEAVLCVIKRTAFALDSLKNYERCFDTRSAIAVRFSLFPYFYGKKKDRFYSWQNEEKMRIKRIPQWLANTKKTIKMPVRDHVISEADYMKAVLPDPQESKRELEALIDSFPSVKFPDQWQEAYTAYCDYRKWLFEEYIPSLNSSNSISKEEYDKLQKRHTEMFAEFMNDRYSFIKKYFPEIEI